MCRLVNHTTPDQSEQSGARPLPLRTLIMAGGYGMRLRPLTEETPKPMLPVNGRPLLEWVITHLKQAGLQRFTIATHYRPQAILDYFGDGQALHVAVDYLYEERPLGTGGALGLLDRPQETLLVVNSDILTTIDIRAMYDLHRQQQAAMTIATRQLTLDLPYGVVEAQDNRVQAVHEKPQISVMINAGIYLIEPAAYAYLQAGQRFDMVDLVQWLIDAGEPVLQFPFQDYWLDVGQPAEYAQAQQDVSQLAPLLAGKRAAS